MDRNTRTRLKPPFETASRASNDRGRQTLHIGAFIVAVFQTHHKKKELYCTEFRLFDSHDSCSPSPLIRPFLSSAPDLDARQPNQTGRGTEITAPRKTQPRGEGRAALMEPQTQRGGVWVASKAQALMGTPTLALSLPRARSTLMPFLILNDCRQGAAH